MRIPLRPTASAVLGFVLSLCLAKDASASIITSLAFTTPTGAVSATDAIPVFLTLTLGPTSDPLATDSSGYVTSAVSTADIEANLLSGLPSGVNPATDPLTSVLGGFAGCSTTFTGACFLAPPYNFLFSVAFDRNLDIEPGASIDFLFGTITPTGGSAPPGAYELGVGALVIQVFDDAFSPSNPNYPGLEIADITLTTKDSGSVFTRDVVASVAPEPGSSVLLLAGLALVGGLARRKFQV